MTYREIAIVILATIGVVFTFISAIGIVRLPDVYARMHAAGKASTLGVTCILLSAGIFFPDQLVIVLILVALFFVTAPIATTTMARAAYRTDPDRKFILHYDDLADYESRRTESSPAAATPTLWNAAQRAPDADTTDKTCHSRAGGKRIV